MPWLKIKTRALTIVWFYTLTCIIPKLKLSTVLRSKKCSKVSLPRPRISWEIFPTEGLWVWEEWKSLRFSHIWSENNPKQFRMKTERTNSQHNFYKNSTFTQSSPKLMISSQFYWNWSNLSRTTTFYTMKFSKFSNRFLRNPNKTNPPCNNFS